MRKVIAIVAVLIVLVVAFIIKPYQNYTGTLFTSAPLAWCTFLFYFFILIASLISLFCTIINYDYGVLRIVLNVIFAAIISTLVLPVFLNSLNLAVFHTQYNVMGQISSDFIKNKTICSNEPLNGAFLFTKINNTTVKILCPNSKYKTVQISDDNYSVL